MRLSSFVAAAVLAAAPLAAQAPKQAKRPADPKRPRLEAGRDTNSASAYYYYGLDQLSRDPEGAAAAFHWASRIDPSWAEPLYAKRIALHLSNVNRLALYLDRNRGVLRSAEVRRIDSLQYEALIRNPILYQGLNKVMLETFYEKVTGQSALMIDWDRQDPGNAAWLAYSNKDFAKAVDYYGRALKKDKNAYWYHSSRAIALYQIGKADSAIAELTTMIAELRKHEKDETVFAYDSKALYEYTIGHLYAQTGNADKAAEAYGRALTEDLSFYMAHAALGDAAAAKGDTATAMQEYELAVQLDDDDAPIRFRYGVMLFDARRFPEAAEQFKKAIEAEPYYAQPYFALARYKDLNGDMAEAVALYEQYIARAAQQSQAAFIAHAKQRVAEIKAEIKPGGGSGQ
jgi:Tfp pilus assembly protein PilF